MLRHRGVGEERHNKEIMGAGEPITSMSRIEGTPGGKRKGKGRGRGREALRLHSVR